MTDNDVRTLDPASHPLEDYWTPERLVQRDRLAALLHSVDPYEEFYSGASKISAEQLAARLVAADVRVGPDEGLRAALEASSLIAGQLDWHEAQTGLCSSCGHEAHEPRKCAGWVSFPGGGRQKSCLCLDGSAE